MQNDSDQIKTEQTTGPATIAEAEERIARLLARTAAREAREAASDDREIDRWQCNQAIAHSVEPLRHRVVLAELSLSQLRNIRTSLEAERRALTDKLGLDLPEDMMERIKARIEKIAAREAKVDKEIAARPLEPKATPRPADPETGKPATQSVPGVKLQRMKGGRPISMGCYDGSRVRRLRTDAGMDPAAFCRLARISKNTLQRLEGQNRATWQTIKLVCRALHITSEGLKKTLGQKSTPPQKPLTN